MEDGQQFRQRKRGEERHFETRAGCPKPTHCIILCPLIVTNLVVTHNAGEVNPPKRYKGELPFLFKVLAMALLLEAPRHSLSCYDQCKRQAAILFKTIKSCWRKCRSLSCPPHTHPEILSPKTQRGSLGSSDSAECLLKPALHLTPAADDGLLFIALSSNIHEGEEHMPEGMLPTISAKILNVKIFR